MVAVDLEYLAESFWTKVQILDDASACWLWSKSAGSHGYGQVWDIRRQGRKALPCVCLNPKGS